MIARTAVVGLALLAAALPAVALPAAGADTALAASGSAFDQNFVDATLRVDFFHVGDAKTEFGTLDRVYRQGAWAGSRRTLLEPFENGRYLAKLVDAATGQTLWSKGFDSYFGEYRTTAAAAEGVRRAYHESFLAPFPKAKVRAVVELRSNGEVVLDAPIDPADWAIGGFTPDPSVIVVRPYVSGDPHTKVDVAILGEGYTRADEKKFRADVERFAKILLSAEPYASRRTDFNIYGVLRPSQERGADEPSRGIWRNTALGATFDSLGSERYMLTEDNRAMRDVAAHVPYDTLFLMVNTPRYGGGGIYNLFCTFVADNQWSAYTFLHEFGHSFGGLADEYYTSSVAYNEFYPKGVEPVEPNITALADPANVKWKDLVTPGTPIPTPWEKADFDAMDLANQAERTKINKEIAEKMRAGAPAAEVDALKKKAEERSLEDAKEVDAFLAKSRFAGKVGAMQGAGYASEGLYRPAVDCLMFSKGQKPLCPVCARAVGRVIDRYL